MSVVLGPTSQEQQISYRISRIDATSYTRTWIGTKAALDAIALTESSLAESLEFTGNGDFGTLVGRYVNTATGTGGTEAPVETQTLDTEAVQQNIFLSPTFQALLASEQHVIRKQFETPPDTRAEALTNINAEVAVGRQALAAKAYDLMTMGAESFVTYTFVLTRTRTCSRAYSGELTLTKIDTLWTTNELVAYTGSPLLFSLPSVVVTTDEESKNLFAGWRQSQCSVTDVSDGSRQMIEQWQLAKWSLDLYARQTSVA